MRVLSVTHYFEDHGGGIERVAGHLSRHFAADGHVVAWAAAAPGSALAGTAISAIPLRCWNGIERATGLPMPVPSAAALNGLRRAVRASDAVVVHDGLYLTSIAALLLARWYRKPCLLLQHIADVPLPGRLLPMVIRLANRLVARPMLAAADQVVFISETTRRAFADVALRRPSRLLFNGVDGRIFHPPAVPGDRRPSQILFVGRFVPKKGLGVIEALARARPDLKFVLAGHGPIDPEGWGMPNVRVVRGLSGASLAPLYRAADLLLLPSVGEGYPLVVQEAMASGLPVLCGMDTTQADPAATAWLTGIAVDLTDVAATADRAASAIDCLAMPAGERAAMAAYAAGAYSWRTMAQTVMTLIEAASARRRPRPDCLADGADAPREHG